MVIWYGVQLLTNLEEKRFENYHHNYIDTFLHVSLCIVYIVVCAYIRKSMCVVLGVSILIKYPYVFRHTYINIISIQ